MDKTGAGTGIFVRLLQEHEIAVALDGPRDRWLTYNVVVDVRSAKEGGTFLSGPAIREAVERWQPAPGRAIGRIVVRAQPANGATHLVMVHYYPLDDKTAARHLKGKGVASLVELAVERDLMKRFPRALISADKSASWSRLWQLVARGRKPFLPIPIEEAYALTREYVLEERQRIRAERKMRPLRRRYEKGKRILKRAAKLLRYGRVWAPK